MESPPTGSLLDPLARTESCGHFLLQRKLGKLVLEQKKKKMGLPWAFCCLDQGKKKKQGTDSICLRGLKGGYPVIHTPIYSERQGS